MHNHTTVHTQTQQPLINLNSFPSFEKERLVEGFRSLNKPVFHTHTTVYMPVGGIPVETTIVRPAVGYPILSVPTSQTQYIPSQITHNFPSRLQRASMPCQLDNQHMIDKHKKVIKDLYQENTHFRQKNQQLRLQNQILAQKLKNIGTVGSGKKYQTWGKEEHLEDTQTSSGTGWFNKKQGENRMRRVKSFEYFGREDQCQEERVQRCYGPCVLRCCGECVSAVMKGRPIQTEFYDQGQNQRRWREEERFRQMEMKRIREIQRQRQKYRQRLLQRQRQMQSQIQRQRQRQKQKQKYRQRQQQQLRWTKNEYYNLQKKSSHQNNRVSPKKTSKRREKHCYSDQDMDLNIQIARLKKQNSQLRRLL